MMLHFEFSPRRIILAGGFALAIVAAPAVAAVTVPSTAPSFGAACPGGEEEYLYTGECLPHTVPNSPTLGFSTNAANPDIPEIDGVPCTGRDSGACIGLLEDQPQFAPPPESTIGSSPTVTGSTT